jgi:hypothetical protein
MRPAIGAAALSAALLCAAACKPKGAEAVADKFVDLYFVEIDQARALPLSTGLARVKIEEELSLVEKVRETVDPNQAKPSVFYKRREAQVLGDHARFAYDITIRQGRDETQRDALISLEQAEGQWRVANFMVREGHGVPRPPGSPPSPSTRAAPAP